MLDVSKKITFDKIITFVMNTKPIIPLFFLIVAIFSCKKNYQPRNITSITIREIAIDSGSIRAIQVQKDSSVFYASSKGTLGWVAFSGEVLQKQQVVHDTIYPNFRALASNGKDVFALSIANPALLYRWDSHGVTLVYKETHQKVFYDALTFFDGQHGIAMGDPTEDCLSILLSNNGGTTWHKIPCSKLPQTVEGEAAFAASNSNMAVKGSNAWLVTGGKRSRVFYTPDMGNTWQVFKTPIVQGKEMTGIYSVDFYDSKNGIIFGGNWSDQQNNSANKAVTKDGGKTWKLIADGKGPGYKSCVQYVPNTEGKEVFAVGSTGISFSNDGGNSWKKVSNKSYYTIRFVTENVAWLGGKNGLGRLVMEN